MPVSSSGVLPRRCACPCQGESPSDLLPANHALPGSRRLHLDWWLAWSCRSRGSARSVRLSKTIRANRDRAFAALHHPPFVTWAVSDGRHHPRLDALVNPTGPRGPDHAPGKRHSRTESRPAPSQTPQFLAGCWRHGSTRVPAFVRMEMITPKTCSPTRLRRPEANAPPPSLDTTQRAEENPERFRPGPVGIDQALASIAPRKALFEDANTGAGRDPGAGPLAGPPASPIAGSSSGGSSPVDRPARAACEVAG